MNVRNFKHILYYSHDIRSKKKEVGNVLYHIIIKQSLYTDIYFLNTCTKF